MDFLDPRKKRAERIRLFVGYILVAIALAMGTLVLVLMSYGYSFDRKTGTVIQNGLAIVGARPGSADIYINGQLESSKTDTRLVLPAGQYSIELKEAGYRPWKRSFSLDGGKIEHLDYALLIPNDLHTTDVNLYASTPPFATQSPDRHWLLIQQPGQLLKFDVMDLNSDTATVTTISLPAGLVTNSTDPNQAWQVPEWSTDNRHVLLRHHYGTSNEYIMVDRQDPASSFNVNQLFKQNFDDIKLRDKRYDQLYLYNTNGGTLQIGDVKAATISPLLTHVLTFKPHDDKNILYVSDQNKTPGQVSLMLYDNNNTYTIRELPAGTNYQLDMARFDGHWYDVASVENENRTYIYRDPETALKQRTDSNELLPAIVLNIVQPQYISFSDTAQFIAAQSGKHMAVYDTKNDRRHYYDLTFPLDSSSEAKWMDGNRLTVQSQAKAMVFDFDGSNTQTLVNNDPNFQPYFDRDYKWLYAIAPSVTVPGRPAVTRTDLVVK